MKIFPTKNTLQLKIREVRQKLMSMPLTPNALGNHSVSSPQTPGGNTSKQEFDS